MAILALFAGGALGSICRYVLAERVSDRLGQAFPWGTLVVNLLACFLLGLSIPGARDLSEATRALAITGFLGGFSTFSTLSLDALSLLREGKWGRGAAYLVCSVVLGVVAVILGIAVVA
jgi:CrcB protein